MTYVLVERRVAAGRHRATGARPAYQPLTRGPGVGPRHRAAQRYHPALIVACLLALGLLVLGGRSALSGLADLALAFR